jgi:methylphosphotriester-DNA--protein-cysteine methyltransferase
MLTDADMLYDSLAARDRRFDGLAFICVKTTGIYCRFGCPARTPLRRNVEFRATVNDCVAAGFRACKRCRPDQIR